MTNKIFYLEIKLIKGEIRDLLNINVSYSQKKINPEIVFKKWADKTNILQYLGIPILI